MCLYRTLEGRAWQSATSPPRLCRACHPSGEPWLNSGVLPMPHPVPRWHKFCCLNLLSPCTFRSPTMNDPASPPPVPDRRPDDERDPEAPRLTDLENPEPDPGTDIVPPAPP